MGCRTSHARCKNSSGLCQTPYLKVVLARLNAPLLALAAQFVLPFCPRLGRSSQEFMWRVGYRLFCMDIGFIFWNQRVMFNTLVGPCPSATSLSSAVAPAARPPCWRPFAKRTGPFDCTTNLGIRLLPLSEKEHRVHFWGCQEACLWSWVQFAPNEEKRPGVGVAKSLVRLPLELPCAHASKCTLSSSANQAMKFVFPVALTKSASKGHNHDLAVFSIETKHQSNMQTSKSRSAAWQSNLADSTCNLIWSAPAKFGTPMRWSALGPCGLQDVLASVSRMLWNMYHMAAPCGCDTACSHATLFQAAPIVVNSMHPAQKLWPLVYVGWLNDQLGKLGSQRALRRLTNLLSHNKFQRL